MLAPGTTAPTCWVIAYGNPQRGDDGIGQYVARRLNEAVQRMNGVALCTLPQLDVALLEEIHGADYLVFVDASMEEIESGLRWTPVTPELNGWAMGTHQLTPTVFLGLLHLLYQSKPKAWAVSIQGRKFDLGEGLSFEARRDADRAAAQIVDWLYLHGIALDGQNNRGKGRNHG
jgi:hydrogenase maturation protease